ncbi:hypothetical protein [Rhodanobacter sp. L36]|uniref:hypothetical protein n=1 Tax=Rhodanobacter sp. L36 TaxID=1747221 RepID=UPI00131D70CE|nr:hypothetical protein [Rhodanobacter sp. L36]
MKSRKLLLSTLVASSLMFGGALLAQDTPPPPPPPAPEAPMPPPPPPPAAPADQAQPAPAADPAQAAPPADPAQPAPPAGDQTSATNQTPQGQVTVNSSPAPAPTIGPAPSFEQLSGGGKSISEDQAAAYPPLANDFINADTNKNGKVSKSEYTHWMKQPQ